MGQANSARERQKSGDIPPSSPGTQGQAFIFDKKPNKLLYQTSGEDCDYDFYGNPKQQSLDSDGSEYGRGTHRNSNTSDGTVEDNITRVLPTVFKWDGGGKQVYITGTFSNWRTIPMVRSHGDFVTIVDLAEGEHEYKFLVDGQWMHDPTEPVIDNGMGSKNNVISVKKSDFEVFDALDIDSSATNNQGQDDYGQEVPVPRPMEKTTPPILPPHLLQVILNKDTPLSCEPTLLPEPNHVMLNHLYALSIKDGVMVLSATHRYRKKYVTTLLYKPI